jgi:ATP-dependent helicase HrpB
MALPELPIDALLPGAVASLRGHPCLVLRASTGAGKTTRLPSALLDSTAGAILLVEPRRLAARAAARRIAFERGCRLGSEVGYHVRFDRQANSSTRLVAMTPGITLNLLRDDPALEGIGCVILDEFHERGVETDLIAGLLRVVRETLRPDLRVVVMSATVDAARVSAYLGGCPTLDSPGRLFPVSIGHEPVPQGPDWPAGVARAVTRVLDSATGDILVFLPGWREIRQVAERLPRRPGLATMPLHGDLSPEEQDEVLAPRAGARRVILSTNVAESSVTVPGVRAVVDSGLARQLAHDPATGLDRLVVRPVCRASLAQRAGRAGREAPGTCLRLFSEHDDSRRPEHDLAEILRVDPSAALLQLAALGELDRFEWLDSPPATSRARALSTLEALGAIREGRLTALGDLLGRLPLPPRAGVLLAEGARRGIPRLAARAAALLSEGEPQRTERPDHAVDCDLLHRLDEWLPESGPPRDRRLAQIASDLERQVYPGPGASDSRRAFAGALMAAFPDRLARRREKDPGKAMMAGGRPVRLGPASAVSEHDLFLCLDVDDQPGEAVVRMASGIVPEDLDPARLKVETAVEFDERTERIVGRRRTSFGGLVIDEREAPVPLDDGSAAILAGAARARLDSLLPAEGTPARQLLARWKWLAIAMPGTVPPIDDSFWPDFLAGLCRDERSLAAVRGKDWHTALLETLDHKQRRDLDALAPARLTLPSGGMAALAYEPGRPPVLAARIQELFGWKETPRIAGGRVRVLLHLLAPNFRPQQVTDDLESFWNTTYQIVRKELRGRYPRHPWPEDPWTAQAVRKPGGPRH